MTKATLHKMVLSLFNDKECKNCGTLISAEIRNTVIEGTEQEEIYYPNCPNCGTNPKEAES